MNRAAFTVAVIATTLILAGSTSLVPNVGHPSDNLAIEAIRPLILAGLFSLVAGYVASYRTVSLHSGALGGAVNALINVGFLLLLLSLADRHFRSIGGPSLSVGLPLTALVGSLFGAAGAYLRMVTRTGRGSAAHGL